jgi:tetratricopeptide (TPR) repeat protein
MLTAMVDRDHVDRAHWDAAESGAELVSEGEYAEAIAELSQVVSREPDNPYALFFLGAALFETGEPSRALKAYLEALKHRPEYLGALIGAGWALHALGRYKEALKVGRQLLLKSKDDSDGLYLLGLCHYALGDSAAALGYLNRFLNTRPEIEVALEVEGLIKVLRGEVQAAPNARALSDDDDDE